MKSKVTLLIFLVGVMNSVCQDDEDNKASYFELGQRDFCDMMSSEIIRNETDLRQFNQSSIEIRYVALHSPVCLIEIRVNATVETFQFTYLNESSVIIRLLGLKSTNPLVTASVQLYSAPWIMDEETGIFSYNYVNRTMIMQQIKEEVHQVNVTNKDDDNDNSDLKLMERMMVSHPGYDFSNCMFISGVLQCSSSALKVSIVLLCSVMLMNFLQFLKM